MEKRYGVLRIIATIYKVLGILIGIASVLGALGICGLSAIGGAAARSFEGGPNAAGGIVGGVLAGLVVILGGAIYSLTLYALGDGISLLLALEENTRLTAALLQQSTRGAAPAMPAQPNLSLPAQNP
jgi:hypothetical protein